jgi:hypothetical protein
MLHRLTESGRFGTFSRTHRPTATSSAESRNGTRQPHAEIGVAHRQAQDQEQAIGAESPPARPIAARSQSAPSSWRGVFHRQQRRAAPFAAKAEALTETADAQQDRRQNARLRVRRQERHRQRRGAHQQQRGHQRRLAPDLSPKWPKAMAPRAAPQRRRQTP